MLASPQKSAYEDLSWTRGRKGTRYLIAVVRARECDAPGAGKAHLAIALGVKAAEAGRSVLFLTLENLMGGSPSGWTNIAAKTTSGSRSHSPGGPKEK